MYIFKVGQKGAEYAGPRPTTSDKPSHDRPRKRKVNNGETAFFPFCFLWRFTSAWFSLLSLFYCRLIPPVASVLISLRSALRQNWWLWTRCSVTWRDLIKAVYCRSSRKQTEAKHAPVWVFIINQCWNNNCRLLLALNSVCGEIYTQICNTGQWVRRVFLFTRGTSRDVCHRVHQEQVYLKTENLVFNLHFHIIYIHFNLQITQSCPRNVWKYTLKK